jgi:hypothetical protein
MQVGNDWLKQSVVQDVLGDYGYDQQAAVIAENNIVRVVK